MDQTKCQEIEPLLDGLFDGELSADEQQMTATHVNQCADCLIKLSEIEAVSNQLAGLPRLSLGRDLSAEILQKAQAKTSKNKVAFFRRKEVWAVAAACLLIGLALQFLNHQPTTISEVPAEKKEVLSSMPKPDSARSEAEGEDASSKQAASKVAVAYAVKPDKKKHPGQEFQGKPLIASSAIAGDEVLAFDYGYQPNLMEGMGLATDEDGLYALKM